MNGSLPEYLKSSYLGWTLFILVAWTLLPHLARLAFGQRVRAAAVLKAPEWGLIAGILAVLGAIYLLDPSRAFFSAYSDQNLIHNVALFGVLSIGVSIVIIAGGIDLSIGSVVSLTSVLAAQLMTEWLPELRKLGPPGAIRLGLAALGVSQIVGLWAAQGEDRRRPLPTTLLWAALLATMGVAFATTLETWTARPSGFRWAILHGLMAVTAAAHLVNLLTAGRADAEGAPVDRSARVVAGIGLALAVLAAVALLGKGVGPLRSWGNSAEFELILASAGLALVVALTLGLRVGAGVFAIVVGGLVAWGLGAPLPKSTLDGSSIPQIVTASTLTLLLGLAIGLLHAVMINSFRLPPFIATLATLAGLRSLAIILGNNRSINVRYEPFRALGRDNAYTVSIFVAIALLASLLMGASVLGRHLYALGGNEAAARLSGLPTKRLKAVAYGLSGLLAALAGLLFLGNTGSVQPATTGISYELYAITAAVVGGCSLAGGVGSIRGTVLGLILIQIVIKGTGIVVRGIDSTQIEGLVLGTVVVLAVAFNQRFRTPKT